MQYVRYDPRGVGMSDAFAGSFTIDVLSADLEAVADAVSPNDPVFWGPGRLGLLAVAFAALHPDRVSKLVLWSTAPVGAEFMSDPMRQLFELAKGSTGTSRWRARRKRSRTSTSPRSRAPSPRCRGRLRHRLDAFMRFEEDFLEWDVTDLLPAVRCPTLVMHPKRSRYFSVDNAVPDGDRH